MTILAFETSCDETSAAVVRNGVILANIVSSQIKLHAEYGGVVPELATREHLRNWLPVTREAIRSAGIETAAMDAIAAARGPGLPNALLIGFKAAQSVAYALRKPLVSVNHLEAHLYSPWIAGQPPRAEFDRFEPNVSLIVSGGHTLLVNVRAELDHEVLGSTLDDAAGECFDKTGKLLGLPYPAGPEIDRLAEQGNACSFDFPRPMINADNDDFSFAGLKTSVRYFLQKHPELAESPAAVRDLCASVQSAIVEVLVTKTVRAAKRLGVRSITASGGVTCNRCLRRELTMAAAREGIQVRLAAGGLCTDNAGMIGVVAERKALRGQRTQDGDLEIVPNWELESVMSNGT